MKITVYTKGKRHRLFYVQRPILLLQQVPEDVCCCCCCWRCLLLLLEVARFS